MTRPKYPLEPLVELRERQVDEATRALGEKTRAREEAARVRRGHEQAAADHAEAQRRLVAGEQGALARGELRAADLIAQHAWSTRMNAEQVELDARVRAAEEAEKARAREEAQARDATARKKADADVVEKDRARFVQRYEARAEAQAEEEALDAWNGRQKR